MKRETHRNGKGNGPLKGYNYKKWNENYGHIDWRRNESSPTDKKRNK